MNLHSIVLFGHVFATFTLFMAIAIETLCLHRMRAATNTDELRQWASLTRVTDKPLPISTVAILLTGLYMAVTSWGFWVPWIDASLVVVAIMFVVGPAVNSRRLDAIAAAAKSAVPGPIPVALAERIQDPVLLTSIHALTALGFGVVFLKAVKPDLAGSIAVLVVAAVIGAISARTTSRGENVTAETGSLTATGESR